MACPPGSLGSNPSGDYEKLLSTVGSLQGDLQRTLVVCRSLRDENEKLKLNFDAVRTEMVRLREKHNTTRAQLLEAIESRVEADQRTDVLVQKWKVQMEAQTREMESLHAKLEPQDMDMLRARVQEELEEPHQRRVAALEAESEKNRQLFFNVRREYERCKAEYEQYTIDQGKELEMLHQQRKAEVHALKLRVQEMDSSLSDVSRDEEVRQLRRRVEEAAAVEKHLHAEISAVRAEKERVELERHKLVLGHQSEAASIHMRVSGMETEKQALQRRCADLEQEASRRRRQAEEARERLEGALDEAARAREALAGRDRLVAEAKAEAKAAADRLGSVWGRERADLKAANEALTKRVAVAEGRVRDVSEQASERVRCAQSIEEAALRETEAEAGALRKEVARLEEDMSRLQQASSSAEASREAAGQRWRAEAERAQSDATRVSRDKEALRERVAALASAQERSAAAAAEAAGERDEARVAVAREAQRAAAAEEEVLRAEADADGLRERLREVEEEMATMVVNANLARQAQIKALKELKGEATKDREAHATRCEEELEGLRRRARKALRKERKKSRVYKAKAIEAHGKTLRARREFVKPWNRSS
ncbi:unnamed protein product [Discosporangium mesarthrocarpum]